MFNYLKIGLQYDVNTIFEVLQSFFELKLCFCLVGDNRDRVADVLNYLINNAPGIPRLS